MIRFPYRWNLVLYSAEMFAIDSSAVGLNNYYHLTVRKTELN